MWLGQLEEQLPCLVCRHCSTLAGAVRWEGHPEVSIHQGHFSFSLSVGDLEWAVCIQLVKKEILASDLPNEIC